MNRAKKLTSNKFASGGELQTLICIEFTCQLIDEGDSAGGSNATEDAQALIN